MDDRHADTTLLAPDDPPPVRITNGDGSGTALLVADHAGIAIPARLGRLGLDRTDLARHIACDIGIADVGAHLAAALGLPLVESRYSRLVIDCNRPPDDHTSIREIADGTVVPGNRNLPDLERAERRRLLFDPYHAAIAAQLQAIQDKGRRPTLVSLHSFTPVMRCTERPWHIGVLSGTDRRMAAPLIDALRAGSGWVVGDNQPYSGLDPYGWTVETHALPWGRPNVLLEIRQDLIATATGAAETAARLAPFLRTVLAAQALQKR
ncbi:MAG: N-formylglutamate amidohydrolase [Alphaproteobacteria bacterium]